MKSPLVTALASTLLAAPAHAFSMKGCEKFAATAETTMWVRQDCQPIEALMAPLEHHRDGLGPYYESFTKMILEAYEEPLLEDAGDTELAVWTFRMNWHIACLERC